MNRKGVLIRNYIIGLIIFTLFVMGGLSMIGQFRMSDSDFGSDDRFRTLNDSMNIYEELESNVSYLQTNIEATENTGFFGDLGVLNALISSSWQTLRFLGSSFGFLGGIFGGVSAVFGIPAWVGVLVVMLITVIIVFVIFSAIFQKDI